MSHISTEVESALDSFVIVAGLAGAPIQRSDISVEYLDAPHRPPVRLPAGKMAVYGFWGDGTWLKIGKAGPNSNARYTSQHYNAGSAQSTLAGSLGNDPRMNSVVGFKASDPGSWIRASTHRVNILLLSSKDIAYKLSLLAVCQGRNRPKSDQFWTSFASLTGVGPWTERQAPLVQVLGTGC